MAPDARRPILVVGTGLIGTSIALALRERGHDVCLDDFSDDHLRQAERLGAGRRHRGEAVAIAVVAVPPAATASVVAHLLEANDCTVTDTASVKSGPQSEVESLVARPAAARFVGGHPLAGRERGGPFAARADLFAGRPWVLTPASDASPDAVQDARWLVAECGATPVLMTAAAHDRGLAVTSHLPQLVASALAAQLAVQPDDVLALTGQGLRDMTRIAASDPVLWADIAARNAEPLAAAIDELSRSLANVSRALREGPEASSAAVRDLVDSGRAGKRRIPGKHGGAPRSYTIVSVIVPDQPGQLARLLADASDAGANVEDLRVEHAPGLPVGIIELFVGPEVSHALGTALARAGWRVIDPPESP